MSTVVRWTLETAVLVREFFRTHALEGTSFQNALARFEELLARAEALVIMYREGTIGARAASARRREVRDALQFNLLPHLVRVGTMVGKTRADLAEQFRFPRGNGSHLAFLNAAKGMLAAAEAQQETLASEGMSETLIPDLRTMLGEFEGATLAQGAGQSGHVGARSELGVVAVNLRERIRLLDGLVRYRYRNNGEVLAAWTSASKVQTSSRSRATKPADGAVPPSPGQIVPAA